MSRVTPDEKTLAMLAGVHQRAEICDPQGAVIGYFQPVSESSSSARYVPNFSEEELARFEQEAGGRTLSEIFCDWLKHR